MKVVGFAGYSRSGKTTLIEQLVALLRARGLRVSVLKHAHHHFDIDHPGKDSWRHRQAGAYEVLVASSQRLALQREYETPHEPDVHALLRELDPAVDWVLVEGFREAQLPKIEVWRQIDDERGARPLRYPHDAWVRAVATDAPQLLQPAPRQPVLDLNRPAQIADWLLAHPAWFGAGSPAATQEETCHEPSRPPIA